MSQQRWKLLPLKRVAHVNPSALSEDTDPDHTFLYLDISAVGHGHLVADPTEVRFGDAPSRARRLVEAGDTVVSTVRTYLRAIWPVELPAEQLVVSTGFAVLRPQQELLDSRFFGWWLQGNPFVEEVVARSVGVSYPAINPADLGALTVPLTATCGTTSYR